MHAIAPSCSIIARRNDLHDEVRESGDCKQDQFERNRACIIAEVALEAMYVVSVLPASRMLPPTIKPAPSPAD